MRPGTQRLHGSVRTVEIAREPDKLLDLVAVDSLKQLLASWEVAVERTDADFSAARDSFETCLGTAAS